MAKTRLSANNTIDTLTQEELAGSLDKFARDLNEEAARGLSTFRDEAISTVATGAVTIPATGQRPIGPRPGWVWALHRLSVQGLLSGDSLNVYRTRAAASNYLFSVSSTATVFMPGSKGIILRGGETLVLTGSSLSATGDITINIEGFECADVDLYKLG